MTLKKDSVKVNFIYNLIYNIINIIVPLLTAPYTSRVLGAANIGIYSYTYSIVSSMILFGALGTATYGQREIAAAGDDIEKRYRLFWEIWILKAIATIVIFIFFLPYAITTKYCLYYLLQIPFFVAAILDISYLFQGLEKFKYIAIRNSLVRIVGIILLFLLVKNQNDLWIYLLIIGVSQMLGNVSMWPYLRGNLCGVKLSVKGVTHHFKEVLIYFIPSVTYQIYAVLDKAMLGWLVGSEYENGYYEQAHKIINMVVNIISAYTIVMRSRMSVLFAKNAREEIHNKMVTSYNFIAFLVFPMTFGLAAVASGMVPWFFGDGYDPVTYLLYLFCPIFIFMGYSRMIGTHILTPSGRQVISNYAQISAAVVNIIFNAILIPRFFAAGAAIASVVSEIVVMMVYFIMVRKEIDFREMFDAAWKKVIAAVVMFVVLFNVQKMFTVSIRASFFEIVIGIAVYGVVLLLLRDSFLCMNVKRMMGRIMAR